ncbi:MAG: high-potential iron-sulfur protein [Gammaproteobacteria bacterium]|nr:high-potential iron-sulfur protein [Gammaproteobacteria bacterium]
MTSDDYGRGYSKGYAAGRKRSDKELNYLRNAARLASARAYRAEKAEPYGHCEDCGFWMRGIDRIAWGTCTVHAQPKVAGDLWESSRDGKPITTSRKFGCLLFLALWPQQVAHSAPPLPEPPKDGGR